MPAAKRTSRTPKERARDEPSAEVILAALAGPPDWQDDFLMALAESGGAIGPAAKAAGIGRTTVYAALKLHPLLQQAVQDIRERSVEAVEGTLYQCAMNPAQTTDRIFYLKTRKPEVYGDKLRQDQVEEIKAAAKREVTVALEEEIAALPDGPREIVMAALGRIPGGTP